MVDSTNAEAQRRAVAGEAGPLWIWADQQTQGRGRLGRRWVSEAGNLFITLLLSPGAVPAILTELSFVAALAVHATSASYRDGLRLAIKWPNDVLLDGHKFCGILVESPKPGCAAIGIGVNLAHAPQLGTYPVTALGVADREDFVSRLAQAMCKYLDIWNKGAGFDAIRRAWLSHAHGLGQRVRVGELSGTFEGLGPDGALILTDESGTTHSIHAGDVDFAGSSTTGAVVP
jgi:BirA family biotin operon repressor/biotin-[acetyl-CoA-carboxylase] ligase